LFIYPINNKSFQDRLQQWGEIIHKANMFGLELNLINSENTALHIYICQMQGVALFLKCREFIFFLSIVAQFVCGGKVFAEKRGTNRAATTRPYGGIDGRPCPHRAGSALNP
jgi:hypothetical protein